MSRERKGVRWQRSQCEVVNVHAHDLVTVRVCNEDIAYVLGGHM